MLLYTRMDALSAVSAQETSTPEATMRALFERLQARMEGNADFTIDVWFISPPTPGEPSWQIPGQLDGGASRRLGEIGDEYVCFIEQGQTFNDSVCIPYSNIRMLTYPN
jgi:hypothetical protein